MSRPILAAADLIATATEPCHHTREPFGPCIVCLETAVAEFMGGMVSEDELTVSQRHVEQLEADVRNHEGHNDALAERFSELAVRQKTLKDEIGEEIANMRSEIMDRFSTLIDETENAEDNL